MKGVQPIVLSRKRRINGEKVESSVDHQRSPSQKPVSTIGIISPCRIELMQVVLYIIRCFCDIGN